MVKVTCYKMTPKINGGWEKEEGSDVITRAIYHNTRGGQVKDSNGNLVKTQGLEMWTTLKIEDGFFTDIGEDVFRIVNSNNWSREGGFIRYSLEKVVGNDGTESVNTSWNIGTGAFS